jgi:hypothetical protein
MTPPLLGSMQNVNSIRINHLNLETSTGNQTSLLNQQQHKVANLKSKYAFADPQQTQPQQQQQQQQQSFRMGAKNFIDFQFPLNASRVQTGKQSSHAQSLKLLNDSNKFLEDILNASSKRTLQLQQQQPQQQTVSLSKQPTNTNVITSSLQLPTSITIINRTNEERALCPDKLILERKGLTQCPVVEGEDAFKLVNYQHNQIRQIQNLDQMRHLIFLDLYNNQLERITGLGTLVNLRVLMLGKNRIAKIENLNNLLYLDILDLHGNQISKIENLNMLRELRVLNLAANQIKLVENLSSLEAMIELNLRRNEIEEVVSDHNK